MLYVFDDILVKAGSDIGNWLQFWHTYDCMTLMFLAHDDLSETVSDPRRPRVREHVTLIPIGNFRPPPQKKHT